MPTALVINGVYEETLSEILLAQAKEPDKPHFLQPYSGEKIKLLADEQPTDLAPITLFLSVTHSLDQISYRARIVGWRDKREIGTAELEALNKAVNQFQPSENGIYLTVQGDKPCVNLISIVGLTKLLEPIPASCFRKVSNKEPLQKRTRAGGWSYVEEPPEWLGASPTAVRDDIAAELETRVRQALDDTSSERQTRLAVASHRPEEIQVLSRAFRRNADVIAEVLHRAKGVCEQCGSAAPFLRASDETPYLEIHHKTPLALGGDDTVANATALCPNCHRRNHFGKTTP